MKYYQVNWKSIGWSIGCGGYDNNSTLAKTFKKLSSAYKFAIETLQRKDCWEVVLKEVKLGGIKNHQLISKEKVYPLPIFEA